MTTTFQLDKKKDWLDYLKARGLTEDTLLEAGIFYKRPWIRIPYPGEIIDREAEISKVVKGRYFDEDSKPPLGIPKYIWLEGKPEWPYLWNKIWDQKDLKVLIICEGELDALLLNQELKHSEVANNFAISLPFGSATFKDHWARALAPYSIGVFLDNDPAGRAGAQNIADKIEKPIRFVKWPNEFKLGGDLNDFYLLDPPSFIKRLEDLEKITVEPRPKEDLIIQKKNYELDTGELEELKLIPINEIIGSIIPIRRTSMGWSALCPFHEDHIPSLMIYRKTNSWYCFACGRGGSAIDFLIDNPKMSVRNTTLAGAINYLKKNYGSQNRTKK